MKTLQIAPGVELPLSVVTSKAAIMAMTGMGKTYLARVMAEEMMKNGAKIIVGDYLGVWHGLQSSASGKREGYPVVVFGGDHGDVGINEDAGGLIADTVVNERINAVLDVSGWEDDAPKIRFMTAFARRLFHINSKPVHFFLDEADEFVPQQPQRDQISMLSVLKRIWQRGRVLGIGGTIISQRPAIVHKTLLTQSEMLIALRTVGPQDRDALGAWFKSYGTAEQVKEFDATIANMPDHHAWFWSPKHKLFVMGKARKAETFDSSKTPEIDGDELTEPLRRHTIDVAALGKKIASLKEEAEANDPVKLKARADHYEKQFTDSKARVELLEARLKKREKATTITKPGKPVKVPFLSAKALTKVDRQLKAAHKLAAYMGDAAAAMTGDMTKVLGEIVRELAKAEALASQPLPAPSQPAIEDELHETTRELHETPAFGDDFARPIGNQLPKAGPGENDGKRRILIALAQHGGMTPTKLRVLAGIASINTFRKYLGGLRTSGSVENNGSGVTITPAGRSVLGTYTPLPTGKALIAYWLGELGGGHAQIFRALLTKPKYAWPFAELMKVSGVQSEHTMRKYIGRLKTLGLAGSMGTFTVLADDFKEL